jgi:hypothetical protein
VGHPQAKLTAWVLLGSLAVVLEAAQALAAAAQVAQARKAIPRVCCRAPPAETPHTPLQALHNAMLAHRVMDSRAAGEVGARGGACQNGSQNDVRMAVAERHMAAAIRELVAAAVSHEHGHAGSSSSCFGTHTRY